MISNYYVGTGWIRRNGVTTASIVHNYGKNLSFYVLQKSLQLGYTLLPVFCARNSIGRGIRIRGRGVQGRILLVLDKRCIPA